MSSIIKRFPPGTWVEQWPHKLNLDQHRTIVDRLDALANAAVLESTSHTWKKTREMRVNWIFNYIHSLGNGSFLEISKTSRHGWLLFHTDEEVIHFILSHQ